MEEPLRFGNYLLLERINVGGMAEVFKAKTFGVEGFERIVALKRILPNIAEDQEFIAMFIDEAKVSVRLTHANIAQVFDLGKVGDAYFIAMEYVHGRDLRAIYDRARENEQPIPLPMACYVTMMVCEGLDYAHNRKDADGWTLNLVHRDVSPQNILISYDGEVKIIDFGIAKAAGRSVKTQTGILKGKLSYMSPEQVRALPLDRRSDIFSLGIVLYELVTLERLFRGESDFSTLEKVRHAEIARPSHYNPRIPKALEQIVLKALSIEVEGRYQTAMDLHDDLQSFMYTSGSFFGGKDLAAYVKNAFPESDLNPGAGMGVGRSSPLSGMSGPEAVAELVRLRGPTPGSVGAQDDELLIRGGDKPWDSYQVSGAAVEPRLSVRPLGAPDALGRGNVSDNVVLVKQLRRSEPPAKRVPRSSLRGIGVMMFLGLLLAAGAASVWWAFPNLVERRTQVRRSGSLTGLAVLVRPRGASIFIDGVQRRETTPVDYMALPPGSHTLRIEKEGYASLTTQVVVTEGLVVNVSHDLEPEGHREVPVWCQFLSEWGLLGPRETPLTERCRPFERAP